MRRTSKGEIYYIMATTGNVQVKNGKWYAVLNLYDENGKRKLKWIPTGLPERGNKKNAEKFLREQLDEWDKKNIAFCKLTVAQYFLQWLEQIKLEVKANTYRNYHANMTNHIIPYFEQNKILLQDLKPYHLEDYYKSKLTPNSKLNAGEALSATTIKHHHQNISKALSDALRRGIIYSNPAKAAKTPRAERYKAEFLNPKQLESLLLLVKGDVIELPVTLCVFYGFRRSEALGLKWHNVDFVNRMITIAETLQQHIGGSYIDTPKTENSYRTLPMTDDIYELLQAHKRLQDERKGLMGSYYKDSDYVCTWQDGRVISPNYLTSHFHKVIKNSTLPPIRLHDLRHSAASNLLNQGLSVVQVQEWLGHSSAATTLNYYAHADKSSKKTVADAMQNMLKINV